MAKDQTEVGITGKPIPKPRTAVQQYKLEKKRREQKHLGTNVGGTQYTSGARYYVPSTSGTNPRARTFEEFIAIAEAVSASDRKLAASGILSKRADDLQREIDAVISGKKSSPTRSASRKVTKQSYEVREESEANNKPATPEEKRRIRMMQQLERLKREKSASRIQSDVAREEYEIDEKFSLARDTSKPQSPKPTTLPRSREANVGKHDDWKDKPSTQWSDRPAAGKKLKSRASAVVGTQKRQDVETGVREEYVDEAKVDAGLSDAEKAKVRTDRRFGTAGAGFVNPKGMNDLRTGLHKANRGLSQQFKRRLRGMKEENVIDEAKVEAGKSKEEKQQIRTARSGFTGQYANNERRGTHRERDELNKDAKDIRRGRLNQPQFQGKTGQERIAAVKKAKGMK